MNNKILSLRLGKFIDIFKNDTATMLEMIFENYYHTACKVNINIVARYSGIHGKSYKQMCFNCKKFVIGEIEQVEMIYNLPEYYELTIDEFFTYVHHELVYKFINIREVATNIRSKTIDDYITMYSEGLKDE